MKSKQAILPIEIISLYAYIITLLIALKVNVISMLRKLSDSIEKRILINEKDNRNFPFSAKE